MLLSCDLSQVSIATARLTLRSFTMADAAESFVEANERIARYMAWNPPASEEEHRALWQGFLTAMNEGRDLSLVIRRSDTQEFLGSAGLHAADGDLLETGIWIKESAQGQGYGHEAVAGVIAWAGARFHPGGFLWPVVDENLPSCKLVERLGGKLIGSRQRQKPGDVMRTVLLYRVSTRN